MCLIVNTVMFSASRCLLARCFSFFFKVLAIGSRLLTVRGKRVPFQTQESRRALLFPQRHDNLIFFYSFILLSLREKTEGEEITSHTRRSISDNGN